METAIAPILHEAMLTPDELPGWSAVSEPAPAVETPFSQTPYSHRFIEELTVRFKKGDTGEILVQHIGVLPGGDADELERDLALSDACAAEAGMVEESAHESWAVAPLQMPPVAEQALSFRLIAGLPDSRLLLADNVYMRRGCVALALVRMDPDARDSSGNSMVPLAEIADRKLAAAAEKIGIA